MHKKITALLVLFVLCFALGSVIWAAPDSLDASFSVPWWTMDSGGDTSRGGQFALSGTVGQSDAGPMSNGDYTLMGGFWNSAISGIGGSKTSYSLYLPSIIQ